MNRGEKGRVIRTVPETVNHNMSDEVSLGLHLGMITYNHKMMYGMIIMMEPLIIDDSVYHGLPNDRLQIH